MTADNEGFSRADEPERRESDKIRIVNIATRKKGNLRRGEITLSRLMLFFEDVVKVPLFRCQRCGECLLSKTGYVCSQRCPKRLRNGPCGGTDECGRCEVYPERRCIWHLIHARSRFLRRGLFLSGFNAMHNWELEKTSAWLNVFRKRIEGPVFFRKKPK